MKFDVINLKKPTLYVLYVLIFIFALTTAIPAYVSSSFLKSLTNEQVVGIFYSIGSIFALISLILIPKILRKYGNYKVTLFLTILYLLNFLGLAFFQNIFLVIFCFMISGSMATAIYFNLDMFLEHNSTDMVTGRIRSIYLTFLNLAWFISPLFAGIIVGEYSYRMIYLVVAIIMIPVVLIVSSYLKDFKDPDYVALDVFGTIKKINASRDIKNIIISNFLLQFFFSWMIIYAPIYLNEYIGFSWGTIGIMFSIILLPFILVQIPAGYLSDKKFGEKEILTIGFLIMGIYTVLIPFINTNNFILWTMVLFTARLGAAMVEVMNDTYLFKNVSDEDLNIINLYRTAGPSAYIVSPIIATILMFFIPLGSIFFILGLVMIFGVKFSLAIKDTK